MYSKEPRSILTSSPRLPCGRQDISGRLCASLNLRHTPEKRPSNIIAQLPDGHIVQAVTGQPVSGFLEVDTNLAGAHLRSFAHQDFLKATKGFAGVSNFTTLEGLDGILEVFARHRHGRIARRTEAANPFSLNEPGQPSRTGSIKEVRIGELTAVIERLGVDRPEHARYQPGGGKTFCSIDAHDYCHMAGVCYIRRVLWSQAALVQIAQGPQVVPRLNSTIDEQRANDLFRWLRDFGPLFGWRRHATPDKLQREANRGGVGIVVAAENRGQVGHIVAVVPETIQHQAQRDRNGVVIAPFSSQAGAVNFNYGTGPRQLVARRTIRGSALWSHP
jgi:hypothetical protein